jgi:hypothetical protein
MTEHEVDDIRPTTERERSRATAIDPVDDETRSHAGGVTA